MAQRAIVMWSLPVLGAMLRGCGAAPPAVTIDRGAAQVAAAAGPATQSAGLDLDALAPARLRIHPLTRLTREPVASAESPEWETQLACHLEFKDRFGHNVKALGTLRVELYRPTPGDSGAAVSENQELVWDLDLRDPDANSLLYDDLVTRTYIVYLGGLPDWAARWAAGEAREPWVTLRATFTTADCDGRERLLEATYRLQH
jgi:hypothetical protein